MRTETVCVSERILMFVIAGQLYDQAPNRQPRNADEIMRKVKENFRNNPLCVNDNEYFTIRVENDKVYKFFEDILFSIPEFRDLNLTQIEYENGVQVDDENRGKYHFISRYDVYDSESWKSDFIDLDAFIQNVTRMFWIIHNSEYDCFLCINQPKDKSVLACGESDKCTNCLVNPNLKNNYECRRQPKGDYTFAYKFDCYKSRYICCEECDDKETCEQKCNGNPDDCVNALK